MSTDMAGLVSKDGSRVGRRVFTDDAVYAAEKGKIFGRTWLYLAHESQLARPGDFVAALMAETPVIVARGTDGALHANVNSCSHRGLPVCRADFGNTRRFVCPYHAWTYDVTGALVAVPQERKVGKLDHSRLGLAPVPRLEIYRGLIFGSFDAEIEPLADYLGDVRFYLDIFLDRFPDGIEVVGPPQKWLLDANWKLPVENQLGDLGHANYLHAAIMEVNDANLETETYGMVIVPRPGHSVTLRLMPEGTPREVLAWGIEGVAVGMDPEVLRYLSDVQARAAARLGPLRSRIKGLTMGIYPNFNFIWSNHTFRVAHPRGPGKTELWSWWIVPKDAPDPVKIALRAQYNYVLGPAGIVEQEDSEAWAQQWAGSNVDFIDHRSYCYELGLGEEKPHPDLPGVAGIPFNEHYARAFYRRWRSDLLGEPRAS